MGNDGAARILQIISPSARTGLGVPSGGGGTSTALTVASGADSITVTSPISIPFTCVEIKCRAPHDMCLCSMALLVDFHTGP